MTRITFLAAAPLVVLVSAGGAAAQTDAYRDHQMGVLQAQQEMDRQRAVALENELNARAAEAQTDRRAREAQVLREAPYLPTTEAYTSDEDGRSYGPYGLPLIPPERLAASNRRVLEIVGERGR
ncbi:MAG: hypothetical protein H5U23_07255 [Phenylobacterium sp.]|nr:hypothetical protein [Phenylobacterium sp.]